MGKSFGGASAFIVCALLGASTTEAQQYRVERIAAGLNQPNYVTQAPGDAPHLLYFTERTLNANGGFGAGNQMGRVWRYDVDTRIKTLVLDLSSRSVTQDTGLQTIAFSPGFNVVGAPGYQKMYLSASETGPTARNKVEEYTINPDGTATFSKLLLQYDNNAQLNHTINWIGFNPTATAADRGYLYISTGDGSYGNSYNAGTSTNGRPSQNPSDLAGKFLRIDVAGADAYPADALKNFGIPASNPIPAYNAANPGSPLMGTVRVSGVVTPAPALGEVWATGVRNGYRASFDSVTGDLWYGDVGENAREEVNWLKAGANTGGPPVDFGWPQLEATSNSNVSGAPHTTTNPFTGVTSQYPVYTYTIGAAEAVMGGYAYHGPITELQGKYFFADFVGTGRTYAATLNFNRNSPPAAFNGANATVTEMSSTWQSLVVDARDPTYLPSSSATDMRGLDHIVSYGEDQAGNVYLVDFGNRSGSQNGFDGQYPVAGLGEIFRLTKTVGLTLTIDRDTGAMTLANVAGAPVGLRGYALASVAGAIDPALATPITGHYDTPPSGNGDVDPDDAWQITSPLASTTLLREASLGDGGLLAINETVSLSAGGGWIPSIFEDVTLHVTLADGSLALASVAYTGNGGVPFGRSDLDGNNLIDLADWHEFITYHATDLSGLTLVEKYIRGDLNGDGVNDFGDFRLFQEDYDALNGPGALAAALAEIPEPATLSLVLAAGVCLIRRRRGMGFAPSR